MRQSFIVEKRYPKAIKPWILPNFESLVTHEKITMEFNANVTQITEDTVTYEKDGVQLKSITITYLQ